MNQKDDAIIPTETGTTEIEKRTLENFKINPISSAETIEKSPCGEDETLKSGAPEIPERASMTEQGEPSASKNPIFRELDAPRLPELNRGNRARLQMQSPTRLFFYWSVKDNPFQTLHRAIGNGAAQNYTLVVKLLNETNGREEKIVPIEAEGSSWFDADAGASYRAEVGFYAPARPFVRVMFSNRVETPRKSASSRPAETARWTISANNFAQVLDKSGFAHDAFEVALAGDDFHFAETATNAAFTQTFGGTDVVKNDASEMRFALLAIASGYEPDALRGQVSHSLFVRLQEGGENLSAEKALAALRENFGAVAVEDTETEFLAPTVFGSSLINFPRRSKRKFTPKFAPVSSFTFKLNNQKI
ncbi:MAG: DUF4912 domain-containing protein [Acidobacteria bacterium]|nr:DUF4912 domain-containing protein [Acidobacteriota bacterium]